MKSADENGLDEEQAKDSKKAEEWLDNFLTKHIQQNTKEFQMIVKGLYRSINARAPKKSKVEDQELLKELAETIYQTIISRNFKPVSKNTKEVWGSLNLGDAIISISQNKKWNFSKLVIAMVRTIQMEEMDKTLTKNKIITE